MSSAGILLLAKEVAGLKDISAGPERAAACSRPRRRSWEALASIQRSLKPLDERAAEGWQRSRAQEALECCSELRDVLRTLQDFEMASGDSHWAATEYDVLFQEVELQIAQARAILGEEAEEEDGEQESAEEETSKGGCGEVAPDVPPSPGVLSQQSTGGTVSTCISSGSQQEQEQEVMRKPVRLAAEELQDEYPHCEWHLNGMCQAGCTVGGCRMDLVEAW